MKEEKEEDKKKINEKRIEDIQKGEESEVKEVTDKKKINEKRIEDIQKGEKSEVEDIPHGTKVEGKASDKDLKKIQHSK
jgi:gamma-glutamyl phosphate reductase